MDIIGERKVVFQPAGAEHEREISLRISRPQQRPDDGWEVQIDISDPANRGNYRRCGEPTG
ncbi:hypothetical protein [Sorangium cellulosum]|uniref:hypothetical protein n=1 Tax=Sorangium cellulosum TaxID=56 RepID=UPI00041A3C14|nr:hypothetical protein [Sorangium cellulosum]